MCQHCFLHRRIVETPDNFKTPSKFRIYRKKSKDGGGRDILSAGSDPFPPPSKAEETPVTGLVKQRNVITEEGR
jgi:hypothetical protein